MPTITDVFNEEVFGTVDLTTWIQKTPHAPTTIGDLQLFEPVPVIGTKVAIEDRDGILALVPTTHRGGPGTKNQDEKRNARIFETAHIQLDDTVHADDALNVRSFGSGEPMDGIREIVDRKLGIMRRSIDVTNEYLRLGAIHGDVAYPTGSVNDDIDLFGDFDTTEQTVDFDFGTATTAIVESVIPSVRDAVESALGGTPYSGIHVLCGRTWFRALIAHARVRDLYEQQLAMWALQAVQMGKPNRMKLTIGDVTFEEYYGVVSGETFISADEARAFPVGVTGLFQTYYAPGDFVEAAGTMGQEMYARQYPQPDGKAVVLEAQSNPLSICTRPRCLVKLTKS